MTLSQADRIWNRAALEGGGPAPAEGDRALADLLLAHAMIMNGGVEHARVALAREKYEAAIAGYRYFGLDQAAELLAAAPAADGGSFAGLDERYASLLPEDATLFEAFEERLGKTPERFSPLRRGEGEVKLSADVELEAAARKRKRSGALAVLSALALFGLLFARTRGVDFATPALLLAALLLAWQLFVTWQLEPERLRKRLERRWPAFCFNVSSDSQRITLGDPRGRAESVEWKDLTRVGIATTDKGPLESDVFYVLETETASLRVPQGAAGEDRLLDRLQQLPGWNDEELIRAMASTASATFTCWTRPR